MSRLPRFNVPDLPYHVIQRGNDRCVTFGSDEDYDFYLDCLRDAADRAGCVVHAYVLMTNHVHLLASPSIADGLGRMMQSVGRRYVRHFNDAHRRTGTLWEGRFKATPIDGDAYLLTCCRYIEMNPVRAGMVARPDDYRWSSWRVHGEGADDGLTHPHSLYLALGQTSVERCDAYRALLHEVLSEDSLAAIRHAANRAWPLGGDLFKEQLAALTARRVVPGSSGRPARVRAGDDDQGVLPL
ncbi:MAG: transposase [Desulfosporosinus sp.]|nr:transposase [Desulfosporosinus sp.]